jgi:26S proteasome regulatory subunit N10
LRSGSLRDQLVTSLILNGDRNSGPSEMSDTNEGGNAGGFEFGNDPSVDSKLALALRMSTEEEQARLDKQKKERAEAEETLPETKGEDEAPQPPLNKRGRHAGSLLFVNLSGSRSEAWLLKMTRC